MKTEENIFFCPMDNKMISPPFEGVLENIQVCVQFS